MVKTQAVPIPSQHATNPRAPGARRAALLAFLRGREPLGVESIARELDLHPNTVRGHLEVLVREGKVERTTERRGTRGRPRDLFTATEVHEPEESYARLAAALAAQLETLGGHGEAVAAGRRWASWEACAPATDVPEAIDEVLAVLRRTGFAPELADDDATILLRRCPFGALAREHTDVVCGAHLGLIQGTLDRVRPGARAELVPFAAPHTCVARVVEP